MSTDYPQKLAEKLKHVRVVELDYSEAEMANALGVSESDVLDYERGTREISLPVVLKYAKSIGVSADLLLDDTREIRPNTGKWYA